jgi:hypothetical protein
VEHRETYGYIFIGTAIRYVIDQSLVPGALIHGQGRLISNLNQLESYLSEYEFHVTLRVLGPLFEMRAGWVAEAQGHDETWKANRGITQDESHEIRTASTAARETLLAESQGKRAYIATDKRIAVDKLTDDIGSLFSSHAFDQIPDIAKFDFEQAGRAIAFELPTAAAFHLMRATEALLRFFYESIVLRNRISEPRMWGPIVEALKQRRTPPPAVLLTTLDSIRVHYRNPTQHPDKVYDMDEVQDLLATCTDVTSKMIRHLRDIGKLTTP